MNRRKTQALIQELRDDEAVQMYCVMLIRGRRDSRGYGPEHVDQVLESHARFSHTPKSLRETVDAYIAGGCGIAG